jgi:hypothetical protein
MVVEMLVVFVVSAKVIVVPSNIVHAVTNVTSIRVVSRSNLDIVKLLTILV